MTEQQKFIGKILVVVAFSFGGWAITLSNWNAALTPVAFGGLLLILASQAGAIFGITTPSAARSVDIALLSGVHTTEQVETIKKATTPGTILTPEVAAAILATPATLPPVEPPKAP